MSKQYRMEMGALSEAARCVEWYGRGTFPAPAIDASHVFVLNPMAGAVEGFQWALLGKAHLLGPMLTVLIIAVVALLISGLRYFRSTEATFADIV